MANKKLNFGNVFPFPFLAQILTISLFISWPKQPIDPASSAAKNVPLDHMCVCGANNR